MPYYIYSFCIFRYVDKQDENITIKKYFFQSFMTY